MDSDGGGIDGNLLNATASGLTGVFAIEDVRLCFTTLSEWL
jgi:hypothetical protein